MKILSTEFTGLKIVLLDVKEDERGAFARAYCEREMAECGIRCMFVQDNISTNHRKNTIRGMHWQKEPYGEDKLIRCIAGRIYDVAVDLREDAPTYLQWFGIELSAENQKALFLPKGFAHGYQTLAEHATVYYKVSQFYQPESTCGLRYDDPAIHIQWKQMEDPLIISEQDQKWEYR